MTNGGIVMYGYKIKQDNGKYYFKLYPGNKPNQYIGESRRYNKKEDCEKALKEFRNFVKDNNLNSFNDYFMQLYKIDNKYSVQYIKNDNVIFSSFHQDFRLCHAMAKLPPGPPTS